MGASWQAFYAHLCAASIIRAMPETEIPPRYAGGSLFVTFAGGRSVISSQLPPSARFTRIHLPLQGRLNVEVCTVPKGATIYGGAVERSETEGEHLAALASSELFPFQLLITFAATTLVGIWSSCFAAACNTPYSARFSPRCIVHRTRSTPQCRRPT